MNNTIESTVDRCKINLQATGKRKVWVNKSKKKRSWMYYGWMSGDPAKEGGMRDSINYFRTKSKVGIV